MLVQPTSSRTYAPYRITSFSHSTNALCFWLSAVGKLRPYADPGQDCWQNWLVTISYCDTLRNHDPDTTAREWHAQTRPHSS